MEFTKNHDAKIMSYTGEDLEEFIALFTEEEVEEMKEFVEGMYGWDFSDDPTEWDILRAYVQEWLIENIRNNTVSGTKHLLKLHYNFG